MGLHEYVISQKLEAQDPPFYALIMSAMRKADPYNTDRLRQAFPETYQELLRRHHAPGGILPEDGIKDEELEGVLARIAEMQLNPKSR
jgi:hypothetical protein